ncbi:hypothetical protein M0R45_019208 [Rubus argutus]|uniref:RNase H type-1 domain-containing protein n=1 Tax=Rubus argutus TaxID=59490 RepID=A0AAW1X648_RUBAR
MDALSSLLYRAGYVFAVKLALELAVERWMPSVVIETDCLEVVRMINEVNVCMAAEGVIVDQIKCLMSLMQISEIMYAPRDANMAAHAIAQFVARLWIKYVNI